jgi:hypothetical protein
VKCPLRLSTSGSRALPLSKQQAIPNLSDLAAGVSGQRTPGINRHNLGLRYGVLASHLKRKSYSGLSPVVDSLLGVSTKAVFLLTRNCSSKFRPLICLMKDRFFARLIPQARLCWRNGWPDHMNENLLWAFNFIFACRHRNLSRPFTWSRRTYEVCLDCGRQVPYSLETMSLQRGGPPQDAANANLPYRIE